MRLQQIGRKNDPHARIVVTDSRQGPKSGKYVEIIGSYNMKAGEVKIEKDRASYWLGVGVQPSVTVHNMLVKEGVIDAPKKNALPKKTAPVKEEEPVAETPAEETPAEETATEEAPVEEPAAPAVEQTPAETAEEAPAAEENKE